MRLRMWGTRGSIATPGPTTLRYGGNTSCVELRTDDGTVAVLDCGTGARELGRALVAEADATGLELGGHILLSHTHWDHIQGLPFFEPLFRPGHWHVYGPRGLGSSLAQTLAGQMQYQYFPVTVDHLVATVDYHELVEGTFHIDDLEVHAQYLNHPALTLGYRIEGDGAAVCYLTDHEPHDPALGGGGDVAGAGADGRHVEFMRGADVVIHDAQYTAAEYPAHTGWGHSPVEYVVDAASAAGVRTTVLFHHDPSHDDDTIDALLAAAEAQAAGRTTIVAAAEGLELVVEPSLAGDGAAAVGAEVLAALNGSAAVVPTLAELGAVVVVYTDDDELRRQVTAAAAAEGLEVVAPGADGEAVHRPMVAVVDIDADAGAGDDGGSPGSALLASVPGATWLLGVTRRIPTAAGAIGSRIDDWLVWPAGPAHLRTRLRTAVLRRACRWRAAATPANEAARLRALWSLGALDSEREGRFDRLTKEACEILEVPVALITLVDQERQWFKSCHGIDADDTHRDDSVCAHTILSPDVLQVPDLLDDDRFADNPVVLATHARFYAGAPLVLPDGHRIGALCVIDHRPRLLDEAQVAQLRGLADEVVGELLSAGVR